jgi:hypothetical protein
MKLISLASLTALAAACGGSSTGGSARFTDASQDQLVRVVVAAEGGDVAFAELTAFAASFGTTCPIVSTSGNTTDVAGGCTDSSGVTYAGSAQFDNEQALFGTGGSGTATLTFDDFLATGSAVVDGGSIGGQPVDAYLFDGTAEVSATGMSATGFSATLLGIAVTTTMDMTCTATACAIGDATLDVTGFGTVEVTGSLTKSGATTLGNIEVAGVDTLTVAPAGSDCVDYTISDGGSGQLCNPGSGS